MTHRHCELGLLLLQLSLLFFSVSAGGAAGRSSCRSRSRVVEAVDAVAGTGCALDTGGVDFLDVLNVGIRGSEWWPCSSRSGVLKVLALLHLISSIVCAGATADFGIETASEISSLSSVSSSDSDGSCFALMRSRAASRRAISLLNAGSMGTRSSAINYKKLLEDINLWSASMHFLALHAWAVQVAFVRFLGPHTDL